MIIRAFYFILLISIVCFSCRPKPDGRDTISIALLNGPSAIAFVTLTDSVADIDGHPVKVSIYDSPDKIQALMNRQEVDIAALPMSTAANLYNKGVSYQLLGCPVWGTLFWVENRAVAAEEPVLHLFGQGSTPDILTRYLISTGQLNTAPHIRLDYTLPSGQAVAQALISRKIRNAILPEPFVSLLMSKDSSIHIRADLAAMSWQTGDSLPGGFPQTAILVRSKRLTDSPALVAAINRLLINSSQTLRVDPQAIASQLVKQNLLPDTSLAKPVIKNCRIAYHSTPGINARVVRFLQLIYDYQPQAIGSKMPDMSFFAYTDTLYHANIQ